VAGSTPFLSLAFFDFGDELDAAVNVQREIERFMIIDKQFYGLYQIFGNGVIDGWIVTDEGFSRNNGIRVSVSNGVGIIGGMGAETQFPELINGLPPNSTFFIYASQTFNTTEGRDVNFIVSPFELNTDSVIKIAQIQTGPQGIRTIDNTVRNLIGFREIIEQEIDAHRHRGTPTKIDLREETKGRLPGTKIADLDANKFTTGIFDVARIPLLDHNNLENSGLVGHAALDSFVQTLSENNKQLLGEVSSVDLMKLVLALKYTYPTIDAQFINALFFIPGVSPSSFFDFEASTASINLVQQCISGVPPSVGQFISILWDDDDSFENAFSTTNVDIRNDRVTLVRGAADEDAIENFESVFEAGDDIPGFDITSETLADNIKVVAETSDSLHTQGFYSGRFETKKTFRVLFTKEFASSDWSLFDELLVDVKATSASHGAVYMFFTNGTGDDAVDMESLILLTADEVTVHGDPSRNNFEQRIFDISDNDRGEVTRIVIYTDDLSSNFEFYLDNILVRNQQLFIPSGTIRFRYSGSAQVAFHSIFYDASIPPSTSVRVRIKTAEAAGLLNRASYSRYLNTGETLGASGSEAEIEVTLLTSNRTVTPTLSSVELRLLVDSNDHGFDLNTASEWSRGTLSNVSIIPEAGSDNASIRLTTPISVGGLFFSNSNSISELDDTDSAVLGFAGTRMPIAPNQAIGWADKPFNVFDDPVSAVRQINKNYIIADRNNDRIVEVDQSGTLVKGFGSSAVDDDDFYPLSVIYNPVTGVVTVVLSQAVDRTSIDVTKMSIFVGATEVKLNALDTILDSAKGSNFVEILLSDERQATISGITSNLFFNMGAGTFPINFDDNDNTNLLIGVRGFEMFVGDFTYIDGIRHPIFASILNNGNWMVGNANIVYNPQDTDTSGTPGSSSSSSSSSDEEGTGSGGSSANSAAPSVGEFDPDSPNVFVFSYSNVVFSDFTLGGISEVSDSRLIISGLKADSSAVAGTPPDEPDFFRQAVQKLSGFRGIVVILDKASSNVVFKYTSPDGLYASDVDILEDGNFLVAESSFADVSGRLVKLDTFGNVVWQYGAGSFMAIRDAKEVTGNNIVIST